MRASSALDDALARLRLEGAIFFRSEFTESWTYESPSAEEMAGMLHPGADRLVMFHIVASGACWVSVGDGERHWARAGDVVVLPYGDQHRVGGTQPSPVVPIASLFDPPPWEALPVLRYGCGGAPTDIVCGYLHSEDRLFDPRLRAFPPVFIVRPPDGPAAQWVQASVAFALEASERAPSEPVPTRLPELVVLEVLRLHLASAPAGDRGWLAAIRDPIVGPALERLHAEPEQRWTVAALAAEVAVSRSLLDDRFRKVLGRSPMRHLTEWRMHLAEGLLTSTDLSVSHIARRVGYDADESFSRAFKRLYGEAPTSWRAGRLRAAT